MFKIIDSVDLEILEDFGYEDIGICYDKNQGWLGSVMIYKTNRKIKRFHPYSTRKIPNENEIKDLIQAGLVEKVGDSDDREI